MRLLQYLKVRLPKWLFKPQLDNYEYHLALLEKRSPLSNLRLIDTMQEKSQKRLAYRCRANLFYT